MSHVSNFTQDPQKILVDLINEDNNASLTLEAVDIALHEDQETLEKNTRALVTPKAGSGYSGSVSVEYNRLDIKGFVDLYYPNGFVIPLGDTESFLDLIPEVEAGLGIKLTEDLDYEDQIIEPWEGIPNETKQIIVPILATSLIYVGELEFTLDGNDIPLTDVLPVNILSGLNLPVPPVSNFRAVLAADAFDEDCQLTIQFPEGDYVEFVGGSLDGERITSTQECRSWLLDKGLAQPTQDCEFIYVAAGVGRFTLTNGNPDKLSGITRVLNFGDNPIVTFIIGTPKLIEVPNALPSWATVTNGIFYNATNFNQDISGWDLSNVTGMRNMFRNATSFNQDLSGWDVSNVVIRDDYDTGAIAWTLPKPNFSV